MKIYSKGASFASDFSLREDTLQRGKKRRKKEANYSTRHRIIKHTNALPMPLLNPRLSPGTGCLLLTYGTAAKTHKTTGDNQRQIRCVCTRWNSERRQSPSENTRGQRGPTLRPAPSTTLTVPPPPCHNFRDTSYNDRFQHEARCEPTNQGGAGCTAHDMARSQAESSTYRTDFSVSQMYVNPAFPTTSTPKRPTGNPKSEGGLRTFTDFEVVLLQTRCDAISCT